MREKILGLNFDVLTMQEAVEKASAFLYEEKAHSIVTPNPEFVMKAGKDKKFKEIINNADLSLVDGIGIVLASKITGGKIKTRVTGCDFIREYFSHIQSRETKVFLLGSKPGIAKKAGKYFEENFKGIQIVGSIDGYYDKKNEAKIAKSIKELKPDIVLVALGAVKQEKWIERYKNAIGAKVYIACGGSFDVYSGEVKRANPIFRKLGLEWLYRLMKEPSRIFRMMILPYFLIKVILAK